MSWPSNAARTKTWGTEVLTSSDLDGQFDLLCQYFIDSLNGTTGHGHTGNTNDGPKIVLTTSVTGALPATNGGTSVATYTQGDILYSSASNVLSKLGAGSSGQALVTGGAGANPSWGSPFSSVLNYGTSATTGSTAEPRNMKIAYGTVTFGVTETQAITNLLFTSASSYVVICTVNSGSGTNIVTVAQNSGSQFTMTDNANSLSVNWLAIGT